MRVASAAIVCASMLACGKPPEPKDQVQRDIDTVHAEATSDKLFDRGKAFHQVGDLTRAEQYYAAAIRAGAPVEKVLPFLIRACVEARRYRVAIEYADPQLTKHPDDWRLRLVVASLYAAIGDNESEKSALEKVLDGHPDQPIGHYALACLLRDGYKDFVGADAHFREYLRLAPDGAHAEEARASLLKAIP